MKKLILLSMFVLLCGCATPPSTDPLVIAKETQLALRNPVDVTGTVLNPDSGTFSCRLTDKKGTEFLFCIDGRRKVGPGKSSTRGRMFLNAKLPHEDGALLIPIDDEIEDTTFMFLGDWLTREFSRGQLLIIAASQDGISKLNDKDEAAGTVMEALNELRPEILTRIFEGMN